MRNEKMVLSAFLLAGGYDDYAWRLPGSRAEELGGLDLAVWIARRYEDAKLDSVFSADAISTEWQLSQRMKGANPYEPMTVLTAVAARTSRIGVIGTFSTVFYHPYVLARQLAALDRLSEGRAGWNIVTTGAGRNDYGLASPPIAERYQHAAEFVEVTGKLWSSWSDDAVVVDRTAGIWHDTDKIAVVDHHGTYFDVTGVLNIPRSAQGRPLLVQAGQSSAGMDFGASTADAIYTAQADKAQARQHYAALKERAAAFGRDPDHLKVLPGLLPYLGKTDAEALDFFHSTGRFIDFDASRVEFRRMYRVDLTDLDLGERVPMERFDAVDLTGMDSRYHFFRHMAEDGRTLRDVLLNFETAGGHKICIGSPATVADTMIDWFESRACDGFSLNAPAVPASVDQICDLLIPELQERGYARTEYEQTTLRGHLGLPVPSPRDRG